MPLSSATGSGTAPASPESRQAWADPAWRLVSVRRETEAIEARASPRKPSVNRRSRSDREAIFDVAWRVSANASSSRAIPTPSSVTRISLTPPSSSWTRITLPPASSAFSSNSLSTDAGRSTISPAADGVINRSGRSRIAERLPGVQGVVCGIRRLYIE